MQPVITAFGTDSSSASLPVTISAAERVGIAPSIARFVLPLGATVNMNGTALYESLTVLFIAQVHNHPLTFGDTIVVALTATLAAIGAAAIPSAGLVTMLIVLHAVGMGQYDDDIAVVIVVDWLLDRCRTAVNVLGDCYAVGAVGHIASRQ